MAAHEGWTEREYRKVRKVPWGTTAVMGLLAGKGFLHAARAVHLLPEWAPEAVTGLCLVAVGWTVLYLWRARTLVGPHGVTARRALTRRTRTWPDVYDIRTEPVPGASSYQRKWLTYLYDTEGRRFLLPHIDDWQLKDPPGEVAELRAVAAGYRGAQWTRRPEVEARIQRRAGRRKAWERTVTGTLIVYGAALVAWVVLLFSVGRPPALLLFLWVPLAAFTVLAAVLHSRRAARAAGGV
ncbi:PH domain-containing protein [Streptomyces sp. NPDC001843]|uniref:PH domain-containing protein n=1 Tax=Streptomyces sp. NPDC001843 TaxID=3364617 RepID=UPI0036D055F1